MDINESQPWNVSESEGNNFISDTLSQIFRNLKKLVSESFAHQILFSSFLKSLVDYNKKIYNLSNSFNVEGRGGENCVINREI